MRSIIEILTFDLVDDICLGLQSGALTLDGIPPTQARPLGPFLELCQVAGISNAAQHFAGKYRSLAAALAENCANWFHSSGSQGLTRVRRLTDEPLAWTDFSIRASRAAQSAGFCKDDAWKLIAAIGEIYGNVVDHSEHIDTGYVAYATNDMTFEFVVSDCGIGVLNSLRKNPDYVHLANSGIALEYALSEGVTRLREPGHGFGFQPIFVGLANISEHIRVRSGDFGRELQRKTDGTIPAITAQRARIEGLFCSVQCVA